MQAYPVAVSGPGQSVRAEVRRDALGVLAAAGRREGEREARRRWLRNSFIVAGPWRRVSLALRRAAIA